MKKITTGIAALAMLFATSAFATETKPANGKPETTKVVTAVKTAFQKQFADASQVNWEQKSGFYFADFKLDGKTASAAYSEDGELVGTLHRIGFNEMPQDVLDALKDQYNGYEYALESEELTYDGLTSYFFTISNGKETVSLKSSNAGDFSVVDRTTVK